MKKKWEKPELVILVRSKTEEGVLEICKIYEGGAPGGPYYATGCSWGLGPCSEHSDS